MSTIKKLADFIDQHKTCDEEVEFFLRFLEICLTAAKVGSAEQKQTESKR